MATIDDGKIVDLDTRRNDTRETAAEVLYTFHAIGWTNCHPFVTFSARSPKRAANQMVSRALSVTSVTNARSAPRENARIDQG
jgi:predicted amidohydrolase